MKKYLISFRLNDSPIQSTHTLLGNIRTSLDRDEKYDKLCEYLSEIGNYAEDGTTSLLIAENNTILQTMCNEIIKRCRLINEDEILIIECTNGVIVNDYRIRNCKVSHINNVKDWASQS